MRFPYPVLIAALALSACGRKPALAPAPAKPPAAAKIASSREGDATWYEAPADSLAARRAGPGELTAASDTLPPGALARVTRLDNGRSVTVRVTDHGIHRRGGLIDLSKEAASGIDMVSQGVTRVRVEELVEDGKPAR